MLARYSQIYYASRSNTKERFVLSAGHNQGWSKPKNLADLENWKIQKSTEWAGYLATSATIDEKITTGMETAPLNY